MKDPATPLLSVDKLWGDHTGVISPQRSSGSPVPGPLQVGAGAVLGCGGEAVAAQLLHLLLGGVLSKEGGLDPVEQPLEPADQLSLGDAQLRVGRCVVGEGGGQRGELLTEIWR